MCEAGRIRHHLKHNLWREDSTIVFVGYQAVGTLGRSLLEGATNVKLFGEPVEVRAEIVKISGISGHADKKGLIHWVTGFDEKQPSVSLWCMEKIRCATASQNAWKKNMPAGDSTLQRYDI